MVFYLKQGKQAMGDGRLRTITGRKPGEPAPRGKRGVEQVRGECPLSLI